MGAFPICLLEASAPVVQKVFVTQVCILERAAVLQTKSHETDDSSHGLIYSQTGCSFARHFATLSRSVAILIDILLRSICNRCEQLARDGCKFARLDFLGNFLLKL